MRRPSLGRLVAVGSTLLLTLAVLGTGLAVSALPVQDDEASPYEYQRKVRTASGAGQPRVVVCEFFTQGSLDAAGKNLAVEDNRHHPVPWRVLQVGPGDACRVAFQTTPGVHDYHVSYGGKPSGTPIVSPAWGNNAPGLIFEARRWRNCDLNQLESIRSAFAAAEPLGATYVPTVFHHFNPVDPDPEPYLSIHKGTLLVERTGRHVFFTSSQDASFLLIDGKQVVAWPGYHGPAGDARFKGEATLTSGTHAFEYVHGASGPDSCMVAAWQPPGADKLEIIPSAAFGSSQIALLPSTDLQHNGKRSVREFASEVQGEAPVADAAQPLIRVRFHYINYGGAATRPKVHWDFGDGQTSAAVDPVHVYLHPGLYTVKLSAAGESEGAAVVNRLRVGRAIEFGGENHVPDQLAAYLPLLDRYDPSKLDPPGLLQLVRVLLQAGQPERAVKVTQAGLLTGRERVDEISALLLAREVGSLLRERLDDPERARAFYQDAARVLGPEAWKAECEVEAADVLLNDLLRPADAKTLLDAATARQGAIGTSSLASQLQRVWGDWHSRQGDRAAAQAAYTKAAQARDDTRSVAAIEAWRGALSRSTEAYLREKQLDRAQAELHRWQDEFPADKVQGYLPLLQGRLLAARGKMASAVAVASDLVAVNPDSAYADRIVFLAGDCEERRNQVDRARARFQSLVTDYPGSPLVADAKARIAKLAARPKPAATTSQAAAPAAPKAAATAKPAAATPASPPATPK
jgi:TolA-binding protein